MDGDNGQQPAWLKEIDAIIVRHCGLTSLPRRGWRLEGRIRQRAEALGVSHPSRYLELLQGPSARRELERLVADVRVDQTAWMRHKDQLDDVVRAIGRTEGATQLWSAGCGRGQEVYSLSMLLANAYPARNFMILGTDLSKDAIAQAARGRYTNDELAGLPASLRAAFWDVTDKGTTARKALRRHCSFRVHNLLTDRLPDQQDVVLVRNVLMYFAPSALKTVVGRLAAVLAPGGILVTGPSEGHLVEGLFAPVATRNGIFWSKAERQPHQWPESEHDEPQHTTALPLDRARPMLAPISSTANQQDPTGQGKTVRHIKGTFPLARLDELKQELFVFLDQPSRVFIVDLDGVDFLCDEAADLFRRLANHVELQGGRLEVTATRPGVRHWIDRWNLPGCPRDDSPP